MSLGTKPDWIKGIRSKLYYGWNYRDFHGILPDNSVILDGYSLDVESLLHEKGIEKTSIDSCIQCGTCSAVCPSTLTRDSTLPARRMLHEAQIGLSRFESPEMWDCTTCGSCAQECPRGVDIAGFMSVLRRVSLETGTGNMPASLRWSLTSVAATGNPLGRPAEERGDWAKGLDILPFSRGMEVLYYPGCLPSYDSRLARVAQATARILQVAGVRFGTLGNRERCCGESARRAGSEGLFRQLAEHNMRLFDETGVAKVVVSSPHCYHTLRNEYRELGSHIEVLHICQLLSDLVREGRLKLRAAVPRRVTYHDPCYLARYNGIIEQPRSVLNSIPGLELCEMPQHGRHSLCCGGGGGRMWMETRKGERLADIRLEQAKTTGADTLVTSCPFCLSSFEDGLLSGLRDETIEVKDITELVWQALDAETTGAPEDFGA